MRKTKRQVSKLAAIQNDVTARQEGPQQKKGWHLRDMAPFVPRNDKQRYAMEDYQRGANIALLGSAGTGKTLLAMSAAFGDLLRQGSGIEKVLLMRSTVQSRNQGFLPGDINEKEEPFTTVYKDKLTEMFGRARTYEDMQAAGKLEFVSTSFQRGKSWDNTVVIFDEAQNANWEEINTAMTRLGQNSRIIIIGDTKQCDMSGKGLDLSGLDTFEKVALGMPSISITTFTSADCVRSGFCRDWLQAVEKYAETAFYGQENQRHAERRAA